MTQRSPLAIASTPPAIASSSTIRRAALIPTDPLFQQQWHLLNTGQTGGTPGMDLNVVNVWQDYTGAGVRVGIIDDGLQYVHPDLVINYDARDSLDVDEQDNDPAPGTFDGHGTSVAGIIAAQANNGRGGVGVAYDATIAAVRMGFPPFFGPDDQTIDAVQSMRQFDVVNNSWSYTFPFVDNFSTLDFQQHRVALENAVQLGRGGRGTVVVFAAGNARGSDSANYHNYQNSRFAIAVAALTHTGVHTYYSSPGANVLVSAFGGEASSNQPDGIVTTDRLGLPGYNLRADDPAASDYTDQFGGTSAAAPMVTGVVALMLQANPNLGYRDVQEILAYSARQTNPTHASWKFNGARNWNGGGLHVSNTYGFGLVDAHAAVRLAETWTRTSTYANERTVRSSPSFFSLPVLIPDAGRVRSRVEITSGLEIDRIEVDVNLYHENLQDVELVLTSPNGTNTVLMSQPDIAGPRLRFTLSSVQNWGETGVGTWSLMIRDRTTGATGVLNRWSLRLYGDALSPNHTYFYTNEFGQVATAVERRLLTDLEGSDTLNAAAITSDVFLNLAPGATSALAGGFLAIAANTLIENAFAGDGNDGMMGNTADNDLHGGRGNDWIAGGWGRDGLQGGVGNDTLRGGRGDDILQGGNGDDVLRGLLDNDTLVGGAGNDTLTGGAGADTFSFDAGVPFASSDLGVDMVTDFTEGIDQIALNKLTFTALTSIAGRGFSVNSEFAVVAGDGAIATSTALIVYSLGSGGLFYNANGSTDGLGNGGQFATFSATPILKADDFVVV